MTCGGCGATGKRNWGRGLCQTCHQRAARADTLLDTPRATAERDSMLEEALILVEERGIAKAIPLANRLGMSNNALTLALRRAERAGDERAKTIRQRLIGVRS